jgi:hypothetical protein
MRVVPALTPHNEVVEVLIVPTAGVPLDHAPPRVVLASAVHCPTHVVADPVIGLGTAFTVMILVL